MKEKRIDIYLSFAGLLQLIFIGTAGAGLNEVIQDSPQKAIMVFCGFTASVSCVLLLVMYSKAKSITKKSKK